ISDEDGVERLFIGGDISLDPRAALIRQQGQLCIGLILVFEPVLNYLKLEPSHSPVEEGIEAVLRMEHLHDPFCRELLDPLVEGLSLAHIEGEDLRKNFRLELGQRLEVESPCNRDRVSYK